MVYGRAGREQKDSGGQAGYNELAGKKPPEISLDSKSGDCQKNPGDTDEQTSHIDQECKKCLSETIDRAHQSSICIQERTDPCKSQDKLSGCGTVKKNSPDQTAKYKEEKTAGQSQEEAASCCFFEQFNHRGTVSGRLCRADGRQEYSAHGVGDSGGEEDAGQSHAGQNPICTQGSAPAHAVEFQAGRDGGSLHALEKSDSSPVCSQGCGQGEELPGVS